MSASNYNWVCFRCHFSMRQAKTSPRVPKCRECGGDCHCLGYKVKVPQKDDAVSWKRLRTSCREIEAEERQRRAVDRAKRKHWLEQEIIRFEAMDENRDRRRLIESLREELSTLP
jgi:hypothetical protein